METAAASIKPVEHEELAAADGHEDDALGSLAQLLDEEQAREPMAKMRGFQSPRDGSSSIWVEVEQDSRDYLGGRVWRASYALLRFLEQEYTSLQGLRILELGAGTGVLGIALAKATPPPAKVVVTDLPALLPLLEANIRRNGVWGVCEALPLDWTQQDDEEDGDKGVGPMLRSVLSCLGGSGEGFDLVLASDCIYYTHLYGPFLYTVTHALGTRGRLVLANDDSRTSTGTGTVCGVQEEEEEEGRWDSSFFALLHQTLANTRTIERRVLACPPDASDGMHKLGGPYHIATAIHNRQPEPEPEGQDTMDHCCGP